MSEQPERIGARAPARVPGDPSRLLDVAALRQFVGAPHAVAILEGAVERAIAAGRVLEHALIVGPDDSGKQVLARALARDALQRPVEVDGFWVRDAKHMRRILRALDDRDALLLRHADELRPAAFRMLLSRLGMQRLPRDADRGAPVAACTLIATITPAPRMPKRLHALRRLCALEVGLPHPCDAARTAAALRAAHALGCPATEATRNAVHARITGHPSAAPIPCMPCWLPGNPAEPVEIARSVANGGC
jgi:hypothetical protein